MTRQIEGCSDSQVTALLEFHANELISGMEASGKGFQIWDRNNHAQTRRFIDISLLGSPSDTPLAHSHFSLDLRYRIPYARGEVLKPSEHVVACYANRTAVQGLQRTTVYRRFLLGPNSDDLPGLHGIIESEDKVARSSAHRGTDTEAESLEQDMLIRDRSELESYLTRLRTAIDEVALTW